MEGTASQQGAATRRSHAWRALAALGVLIFAWGGNYTWIKIALRDIGPFTFNALRFCAAAGLVGLVLIEYRGWRGLLPVRGERASLAVIGLLPGAVLTVLITLSLMWINATHTVLLIYTSPVWTLLLSIRMLGERLTLFNASGALLGLTGIVLLTNPLAMSWETTTLPGVAAALVGSAAWALGSVLYRRRVWQSTFWQQVFWQLAGSGLLTAAAAAQFEWGQAIRLTPELVLVTIYNILVPTALAFWCWSQALSRVKATTATQVLLLSPVFGVAQSHLVLGEPLTQSLLASAACIVLGACLTVLQPRARSSSDALGRAP
jgi:drug/metabolite transporter (DMT)-like permease